MIALTAEAMTQIVVLIAGLIVTIAGGVIYILKRQADTKLEIERAKTKKAEEEAEKKKADSAFQGRVLSVLENTLAQFAQEREDAKHDTQRFAAVMETNAASKNALATEVHVVTQTVASNTEVVKRMDATLNQNTQTVGTHTERVGSVEQRLTSFETEIRSELQAIVEAVRNGLSDERMTPLIERVVQTTIERVKEAPAEPPAQPALVPKEEPPHEQAAEESA